MPGMLGMGQKLDQFLKRPLAALRLHRCRIWTDLVGRALLEDMTYHAYPAD